jgi:hypothetical protein
MCVPRTPRTERSGPLRVRVLITPSSSQVITRLSVPTRRVVGL